MLDNSEKEAHLLWEKYRETVISTECFIEEEVKKEGLQELKRLEDEEKKNDEEIARLMQELGDIDESELQLHESDIVVPETPTHFFDTRRRLYETGVTMIGKSAETLRDEISSLGSCLMEEQKRQEADKKEEEELNKKIFWKSAEVKTLRERCKEEPKGISLDSGRTSKQIPSCEALSDLPSFM